MTAPPLSLATVEKLIAEGEATSGEFFPRDLLAALYVIREAKLLMRELAEHLDEWNFPIDLRARLAEAAR